MGETWAVSGGGGALLKIGEQEQDHAIIASASAAIELIAATPGYDAVARDLRRRLERGRLRFVPTLEDRAQAGLTGVIRIGPEAMHGTVLSLAATLVHEHYHLRRQHPLHKTVSFWNGVLTRRPVMRAYEAPAYRAQEVFLEAVAAAFPNLADEALQERSMVAAAFSSQYGC